MTEGIMETVVSSIIILIGAAIMLASVVKSGALLDATPLIAATSRGPIVRLLRIHRWLMVFFLVGYVVVAVEFLLGRNAVGRLLVSIVFLFGAGFVLLGVILQLRMLLEIRLTFHGVVPICAKCRRVRQPNSDPSDRESWMEIEGFISTSTEAGLAEGFCPDCMDKLYGLNEGAG